MSRFKRSQAKYVKQTHTITNWPAYDQALVTRGSLTFWFTDEAISQWTAPPSGNAGGQRKYSNLAIETALAFRTGGLLRFVSRPHGRLSTANARANTVCVISSADGLVIRRHHGCPAPGQAP